MLLTTTFRGLEFRVQGLGKGFNSRLLECFGLSTGALITSNRVLGYMAVKLQ